MMNRESWFCPNGFCTSEAWIVQCDSALHEIWWVAEHAGDSPFMIAATVPICPRCGTALLMQDSHEDNLGEQISVEVAYV